MRLAFLLRLFLCMICGVVWSVPALAVGGALTLSVTDEATDQPTIARLELRRAQDAAPR